MWPLTRRALQFGTNRTTSRRLHVEPCGNVNVSAHGEGLVFLEISRGVVISGNETVARIWAVIQRGEDLDRLAKDMSEEMSCPEELIRADIDSCVADLQKHRLVKVTKS